MNEWAKVTDTVKIVCLKHTCYVTEKGTEIIKMATEAYGNRNSKEKPQKWNIFIGVLWNPQISVRAEHCSTALTQAIPLLPGLSCL